MQQIKISDSKIYDVTNVNIEEDKMIISFEKGKYDSAAIKTDFSNLSDFRIALSDIVEDGNVIQIGEYSYGGYVYSSDIDISGERDKITLSKSEFSTPQPTAQDILNASLMLEIAKLKAGV